MFRKSILILSLSASALALTGCSSLWTGMGNLSYGMAELTDFSFLRGSSKKSDVSFADANITDEGVYKTAVGEYVPADVSYNTGASYNNVGDTLGDNSQEGCPEGTYLTADNACMFLETETFDFDDTLTADMSAPIDTGPVPCPEDTYLTADNTCTYLETETYDFGEDLMTQVQQPLDTGPIPCPEGTYLTADNTCTYLEVETFDFAIDNAPVEAVNPSQEFVVNQPTECPEGFTLNADNSCMFLGAELQVK